MDKGSLFKDKSIILLFKFKSFPAQKGSYFEKKHIRNNLPRAFQIIPLSLLPIGLLSK
jgi:hypothetical protein